MPNQNWYNLDGSKAPLEDIFASNGITTLRQRHFVGINNAYDHESNLQLAKRAKAAGMSTYIDLHFRDGWNDPQTIQCYQGWGNTIAGQAKGIYDYCYSIGNSFSEHGIIPKYISLGNEIIHGICRPGNLSLADGARNTATFLTAAARGIRDSKLGSKPQIILHLENGWNFTMIDWWLDAIHKGGLNSKVYQIVGLNTYPYYHPENATQKNFYTTIKMIQSKFKKQVMLVESAWPRMATKGLKVPALPVDTKNIPVSVEGQRKWIKLMGNTAKISKCLGTAWFEPAWLPNANTGSNFADTLLFDNHGRALPSLAAFKTL